MGHCALEHRAPAIRHGTPQALHMLREALPALGCDQRFVVFVLGGFHLLSVQNSQSSRARGAPVLLYARCLNHLPPQPSKLLVCGDTTASRWIARELPGTP